MILLCDGHSSHYTPEAISGAAEVGVIICIPPNFTQAAQPLDVSFFGPLKRHWSSVCHEFLANNPGSVVTKLQFSQLFSQAWMKSIKPENILSGFKTGICPLDSGAIMSTLPSSCESDSTEAPSKTKSKSSLDEKGSSQSTGKTESTETLALIPENQQTQAPLDKPDLLPP